jgi:hypothetical protein
VRGVRRGVQIEAQAKEAEKPKTFLVCFGSLRKEEEYLKNIDAAVSRRFSS